MSRNLDRRLARLERSRPGPAADEIRDAFAMVETTGAAPATAAGQIAAQLLAAVPAWTRREEAPPCPIRVRSEAIVAALRPPGPVHAKTLDAFVFGG